MMGWISWIKERVHMKIVKAGFEILTKVNGFDVLRALEAAGRTCYKSEDKITGESAVEFVKNIIKRGHEAMIEHYSISARIICDRGVSHEIVRHRLASYAQESTRYCNYSKNKFGNEITVIKPCFFNESEAAYGYWETSCKYAEITYFHLLELGAAPQEARSVLPNSLKTEIVVTMNLREWRHFFKLRTATAAHPQMREITVPMLAAFRDMIPVIFDDLGVET
jgi:thymidylate synthase (FAD)